MFKQERIEQMEDYISNKKFVTMNDLCDTFSISMNTARADIKNLVDKGRIQKVYGGVSSKSNVSYTSFEMRKKLNIQKKRKIAKAAASFIEDGDIIFIDSGTTTMHIIDFISPEIKITVVTNSLSICNQASSNKNIQLICTGGTYQSKTNSFITYGVVNNINNYNIMKAFMSATGVSINGDLTNSVSTECEIKKAAVQCCEKKIFLADSSKLGKVALLTYATIAQMDVFITDQGTPDYFKKLCNEAGTVVVLADVEQE
ncbi:MAG: DeoR/GlpR family DNA-binding transcription regulator [Oscillospiraceae bacterium]